MTTDDTYIMEDKMKLYVTRHGQTIWNAENKVCGLTDVDLNDIGIKQAETLAKYILEENIKLDLIIASPLIRALKTAETIGRINNVKVITDNRLIEQNYGIYEGVDRMNVGFRNNKKMFASKYPGGESMMQVAGRIYGFLDDIKEQFPNKNVLLVSHGGLCRVLNTYFEDVTNDEFYHWQMENTQLLEYTL